MNLADDAEILALMKAAGFIRVFLGIETPVEASLKEAHKLQNTQRSLLDSVRCIQEHGIEVMAGFIVGFDSDPDDVFDRQVEFIEDSAIPIAMVGLLQALPGTQLYRRMEREGRLVSDANGNNIDCVQLLAQPGAVPHRLVRRVALHPDADHSRHPHKQNPISPELGQLATHPHFDNHRRGGRRADSFAPCRYCLIARAT